MESTTQPADKDGEHPWGDAGQVALLALFLVVWGIDSFWTRWTTFLAASVPMYLRLGVLGVLFVLAGWFMASAHTVVCGRERPNAVVSTGAYQYVRHPLYLGSMLCCLALAVAMASLLSLVPLAILFAFYDFIAGYEERVLETRFGETYREYRNGTGRWLPTPGPKR